MRFSLSKIDIVNLIKCSIVILRAFAIGQQINVIYEPSYLYRESRSRILFN